MVGILKGVNLLRNAPEPASPIGVKMLSSPTPESVAVPVSAPVGSNRVMRWSCRSTATTPPPVDGQAPTSD